jgi:hypothetical protein
MTGNTDRAQMAARTQYPTQGHKLPPTRVRAARRIQTMVNADTGPEVARDVDDRLRTAVADHLARRERVLGLAVGAWSRASDDAGHLGGGLHLVSPAAPMRYVMLGH